MDMNQLRDWIGRTETRDDAIALAPTAAMAATMDLATASMNLGTTLPPLWHWLYFIPLTAQNEIGPDGHPKRGGFLPPVPLPRRMWAGGRLEFLRDIKIGDMLTRRSEIKDVTVKEGRSGSLVFVTVSHEFSTDDGVAVKEEHDIVYRDNPQPNAPTQRPQLARTDETFSREIVPDPVLLFRYSALTFNGHRIHYDRTYVTEVEGYPGLIVHGPLIATFLVDLLQRNLAGARISRFNFRAVRPLFDINRFTVCGRRENDKTVALWTRDHEGWLTMEASAEVT